MVGADSFLKGKERRGGSAGLRRTNRREIPRLRRPAASQERSRRKNPVWSARNDRFLVFLNLVMCGTVIFLLRNAVLKLFYRIGLIFWHPSNLRLGLAIAGLEALLGRPFCF